MSEDIGDAAQVLIEASKLFVRDSIFDENFGISLPKLYIDIGAIFHEYATQAKLEDTRTKLTYISEVANACACIALQAGGNETLEEYFKSCGVESAKLEPNIAGASTLDQLITLNEILVGILEKLTQQSESFGTNFTMMATILASVIGRLKVLQRKNVS